MALGSYDTGLPNLKAPNMQELIGKELENSFNRVRNKYAEPAKEAEILLQHAQAQNQMRQAQFGNLTGPAAKIFSIRMLEQQLGSDDPTVISAKKELELERESQRLTNERNQVLNDTAYYRQSTPYGKHLFEQREVEAGYAPGTMLSDNPVRLTPEQQSKLLGQYEAQGKLKSSDTQTRQRELVAKNLDQTLDLINVDDLVKYSGLSGGIDKKIEQGKSLTGKESENYKKFQENLVRAEILSDQIRAYFGTSINPSMTARLEKLTNPGDWLRSPDAAKRNFLALKELLKIESETYKKAANPVSEKSEQFVQALNSKDDPFGIL